MIDSKDAMFEKSTHHKCAFVNTAYSCLCVYIVVYVCIFWFLSIYSGNGLYNLVGVLIFWLVSIIMVYVCIFWLVSVYSGLCLYILVGVCLFWFMSVYSG